MRARVLVLALTGAAGCGFWGDPGGSSQSSTCAPQSTIVPDHGPPPLLSDPRLSFDVAEAVRENASRLPAGFTTPPQTVCSSDVTRGFLAELEQYGIRDSKVPYEWAPIVSGPDSSVPTVAQPEFFASGAVQAFARSMDDFRPAHPFGFDTTWDLTVDGPFRGLVYNRPGDDTDTIHCEIESGLYPDASFAFTPAPGDRMLLRGSWIFDCGHPPYEAELHPPTFVALARADGSSTLSLAFANPYRVSQLYGPSQLATAFDQGWRYRAPTVAPFANTLEAEAVLAATYVMDHFELNTLLETPQFDPVTWFVCAGPKPSPTATLAYSYRFVARSGVTITAARRGTSGCIEFHAEMNLEYGPATPTQMEQAWPWAQINAEASQQIGAPVDIRQQIIDDLAQQGFTQSIPALQPDASPMVETFAPLAPLAGAELDAPTAIVGCADDQPFPFYGRARVYWK
jgi:hypothetical protein